MVWRKEETLPRTLSYILQNGWEDEMCAHCLKFWPRATTTEDVSHEVLPLQGPILLRQDGKNHRHGARHFQNLWSTEEPSKRVGFQQQK